MLLGPKFSKAALAETFATPIHTNNFVLRPRRREDVQLIADYFNAEDHAALKKRRWDIEDYDTDYVSSTIYDHLETIEERARTFHLPVYNADESALVGELHFLPYSSAEYSYVMCNLLPSFRTLQNVDELHRMSVDRMVNAGLSIRQKPDLRDILRDAFNKTAGNAIQTPHLTIRPHRVEDNACIADFLESDGGAGREEAQLHNAELSPSLYHAREINLLEQGNFAANIFTGSDQTMIGYLNFWQDQDLRYRMSYFLLPSWRGKGYASEAHKAGLAWSDTVLPKPVAYAAFIEGNEKSRGVLLKSGFHQTGQAMVEILGADIHPMIIMERLLPKP